MGECEKLAKCGFIRKYKDSKSMACRGFIHQYCNGPKQDQCQRKEYSSVNGRPPSDDMLPSGKMVVVDEQ
ncbi:hypothetical protein EG831_00165 [bacterium]|nr:hypothetical protein [bacterium]